MDNYNIHYLEACDELLEEQDEDALFIWRKSGRIVVMYFKMLIPEQKERDA